jgi:type I restriction enzyme S subunit
MKQNSKHALTPKLRFPEFRDEPGWEAKFLGNEGEFLSSLTGKGAADFGVGNAKFIPYMNVFSNAFVDSNALGTVKVREHERQNAVAKGDVLFTVSSETPEDAGMASVVMQEIKDCYLNSFCTLFRFDEHKRPHLAFTGYLMRQPSVRQYLSRRAQGSTRFNLSKGAFGTIPIAIPSVAEQRKIADCLSSLDEVITAQVRKVEALKARKKGLMQQLFPRDGETVPNIRFPEFRSSPAWEPHELGPMTTKIGSGITPTGGDKNYKPIGRPFIRSQNVGWGELLLDDVAYIDEQTHRAFSSTEIAHSDVLLNITGASIGRSVVADARVVGGNVNQHVCVIRVKKDALNPALLNQYLNSDLGQKQIDSFQAGGNRQGLNFGQIRSFLIPLPPTESEQKRIADLLTTLDARITAQTGKLRLIRTHKAGLMQQLFPSPKESEA